MRQCESQPTIPVFYSKSNAFIFFYVENKSKEKNFHRKIHKETITNEFNIQLLIFLRVNYYQKPKNILLTSISTVSTTLGHSILIISLTRPCCFPEKKHNCYGLLYWLFSLIGWDKPVKCTAIHQASVNPEGKKRK